MLRFLKTSVNFKLHDYQNHKNANTVGKMHRILPLLQLCRIFLHNSFQCHKNSFELSSRLRKSCQIFELLKLECETQIGNERSLRQMQINSHDISLARKH